MDDDIDEDDSLSASREVTADTREVTADTVSLTSYDESELSVVETGDATELLIDIVFGHSEKPTCAGLQIDWRRLDKEDLPTLSELALVEFHTSFTKELRDSRKMIRDFSTPHIHDVFTLEPRLNRGNITLALCVRSNCWSDMMGGGDLMWRDEEGNLWPIQPPFHLSRVASISGTSRIIESLSTNPLPGTLMHYALTRNANAFVEPVESVLSLNPELYSSELNESQKQAVATLCSDSFTEGFFLIHGPPGTGKTLVGFQCVYCSFATTLSHKKRLFMCVANRLWLPWLHRLAKALLLRHPMLQLLMLQSKY